MRKGDAVLHQHLGHVEVDAVLEGDGQGVGAVVGALRGHVHHALDAVDLLLDRRGDGVGDDLGAGAGILAVTSTVGGVISGYCASGKLKTATAPARVMTIDSTEAKIGRSMKNFESTARFSRVNSQEELL